jgi:hypothetical protein
VTRAYPTRALSTGNGSADEWIGGPQGSGFAPFTSIAMPRLILSQSVVMTRSSESRPTVLPVNSTLSAPKPEVLLRWLPSDEDSVHGPLASMLRVVVPPIVMLVEAARMAPSRGWQRFTEAVTPGPGLHVVARPWKSIRRKTGMESDPLEARADPIPSMHTRASGSDAVQLTVTISPNCTASLEGVIVRVGLSLHAGAGCAARRRLMTRGGVKHDSVLIAEGAAGPAGSRLCGTDTSVSAAFPDCCLVSAGGLRFDTTSVSPAPVIAATTVADEVNTTVIVTLRMVFIVGFPGVLQELSAVFQKPDPVAILLEASRGRRLGRSKMRAQKKAFAAWCTRRPGENYG